MDMIALLVLVTLILFVILLFWKKSRRNVEAIMEGNKNVAPLFLEKSAGFKFNTIRSTFNADHPVSLRAQQLNKDFVAKNISIEQYHDQLEQLLKENMSR